MAKALDLGLGKRLASFFLKTTDQKHLPEEGNFLSGLQVWELGDLTVLGAGNVGVGRGHGAENMLAQEHKIKTLRSKISPLFFPIL